MLGKFYALSGSMECSAKSFLWQWFTSYILVLLVLIACIKLKLNCKYGKVIKAGMEGKALFKK